MLHIIKRQQAIAAALKQFESNTDAILLIEDAVYLANPNHHSHSLISAFNRVFVLAPDLRARGLSQLVSDNLTQVEYLGFVELTESHSASLTWD
jgi:tRNA 2-thiouridine synthesizing protein B